MKQSLKFSLVVSAAFSTTVCLADPFTGAFIEGAIGSSINKSKFDSVTMFSSGGGNLDQVSTDRSKSVVAGRLGVGYGYSLPNNFNLTGFLTYSTPQKADTAGSKLKNNVSLLLQPGYYISSARTLVYGTVGYATASFDLAQRPIPAHDLVLNPKETQPAVSRNSPPVGDGSFRASGLVVGLGAKYAATDRLYAGFDYTHTDYHGTKEGDVFGWNDQTVRNAGGNQGPQSILDSHWRAKAKAADAFLVTIGYRFF